MSRASCGSSPLTFEEGRRGRPPKREASISTRSALLCRPVLLKLQGTFHAETSIYRISLNSSSPSGHCSNKIWVSSSFEAHKEPVTRNYSSVELPKASTNTRHASCCASSSSYFETGELEVNIILWKGAESSPDEQTVQI